MLLYVHTSMPLYIYEPRPLRLENRAHLFRVDLGQAQQRRGLGLNVADMLLHRCTSCHAPSFQLAARSVPTSSKPIFSCRWSLFSFGHTTLPTTVRTPCSASRSNSLP